MPVGIRIKLPGVTQAQFDEVNGHVNAAGDKPNGLIFHSSGPIDGGWGVIDFWESRELFDAFFTARVAAAMESSVGVKMESAPDVKEFSVHEIYAG